MGHPPGMVKPATMHADADTKRKGALPVQGDRQGPARTDRFGPYPSNQWLLSTSGSGTLREFAPTTS